MISGQIHRSGQCFRMEELGEGWFAVVAADKYLEIRQQGKACEFYCSPEDLENFWKSYFDLETDYGSFIRQIDEKDVYLTEAAGSRTGNPDPAAGSVGDDRILSHLPAE